MEMTRWEPKLPREALICPQEFTLMVTEIDLNKFELKITQPETLSPELLDEFIRRVRRSLSKKVQLSVGQSRNSITVVTENLDEVLTYLRQKNVKIENAPHDGGKVTIWFKASPEFKEKIEKKFDALGIQGNTLSDRLRQFIEVSMTLSDKELIEFSLFNLVRKFINERLKEKEATIQKLERRIENLEKEIEYYKCLARRMFTFEFKF